MPAAAHPGRAGLPAAAVGVMGDQGKRKAEGSRQAEMEEGDGVDRAFDVWLQRGLHRLYDTVAKEALPPELLRLIAEDRSARRSGEDEA